ncbi:MAG: hypothetical protein LBQ43_03950 [Holosporales bacterium]|jgi:hypothetical protein|nr:hypothetical protein [Holosporales bacterium]
MNVKKVLVAALCVMPVVANAEYNISGFFCGINGGGGNGKLVEYFLKNGAKAKDKVEGAKVTGGRAFVGGEIGGGAEFNGFYVGLTVNAAYGFLENKTKTDQTKTVAKLALGDATTTSDYDSIANLVVKPKFEYGAALLLGGKVTPNVLAYLSLGFVGTYHTVDQTLRVLYKVAGKADAVAAADKLDTVNGFVVSNGTTVSLDLKADDAGKALSTGYETAKIENKDKVDAMKITTFGFVPGVGVKYFLESGVYIGVDVGVKIGFGRKADAKYAASGTKLTYTTTAGTAATTKDLQTLANTKHDLYLKEGVGVRAGISVGYKF